jgi:hypothetical protein
VFHSATSGRGSAVTITGVVDVADEARARPGGDDVHRRLGDREPAETRTSFHPAGRFAGRTTSM